ncbi:MAG: sulfatase family protein [Aureliella sp.]
MMRCPLSRPSDHSRRPLAIEFFVRKLTPVLLGAMAVCLAVCLTIGEARSDESKPATKTSTPNIVYLLCDDLGVGDVRSFNSESKIATPNMDALAAGGMRFTDAHSGSAVCTPTRYGVLCGRYAWRTRLQNGVLGGLSPSLIAADQWTVPKLLKQRGYHSACIGKWHLGLEWQRLPGKDVSESSIETPAQTRNVNYDQPFSGGPLDAGFDEYFGISASLDMVPYVFLRNRSTTAAPTVEKSFGMRFATDKSRTRVGPGAVDFTAEDVLPRLTSEAIDYLERRAADPAQQPFFLYLPFASPHTPIAPTKEWEGKSGLNPYADFVMQQDECIGRVLQALDRLKLSGNTIVFFTSDNGCSPQADLPALRAKGHDPCRPFRGHKADIFEGGHRVPMVVRWPGVVPAGSRYDHTVCLTDLMATVAQIVDQPLPAEAGPDSFSWLAALKNPEAGPVRPSTVHHSINGSFAIRQGRYKLCFCADSGGWSAPKPAGKKKLSEGLQLFDLQEDIAETTNVAEDHPELVLELARLMEDAIRRGRSTPGKGLANDVLVDLWKRIERPAALGR